MAAVDMGRCWANTTPPDSERLLRCHNRVSNNPDHVGLCKSCIEAIREGRSADELVRDIRDDAINGILDREVA